MRTISIGAQGFEDIRVNGDFYIDKTLFIREWWESRDIVTLITRPRRFGKTLNIDMLNCFFSNKYKGRSDLFKGLNIWNEERYRVLQGTYPVIAFSLADVKETTFAGARRSIIRILQSAFEEFSALWADKSEAEKQRYTFMSISVDSPDADVTRSVQQLSLFLKDYYGKKVLIFLDEYDTPLQEAYVNGYWKEMSDFTRSLFNSTFKTNPSMERGLMTGITRVSKESIFSDLNNLAVITTTSEQYETSFGFTQEEVTASLCEAGLADQKENVRRWYDGFTFGSHTDIYNPWSITSYLKYKKFRPYWADTSSNKLIENMVRGGSDLTKQTMLSLLNGEEYVTQLDEQVVFEQLAQSESAVWSLLLAGGYLRVKSLEENPRTMQNIYHLALTDFEVELMFETMIRRWFDQPSGGYNSFLDALMRNDIEAMNVYINQVSEDMISFFDSGNQPSKESEPERFWHGFVLGLLAGLRDEGYEVTSNRVSGFGRYDIMIVPLDFRNINKNAYIIEFKVIDAKNGEKSLNDTAMAALEQINEKDYDNSLISRGFPSEKIRHYGFAFRGKRVKIMSGNAVVY